MPAFNHHDLTLLNPAFDSPLVDVLTELEFDARYRSRPVGRRIHSANAEPGR